MSVKDEIDIEVLRDLPNSSKIIIKGVESHYDLITSHVILMHGVMSSLLGPLMYQAAKEMKVRNEIIKDAMVLVLKHVLAICEACEFELPENDELVDYDLDTNYVVKNDSILLLTDMCMASLNIIHIVHVELEGLTIWNEESPPENMINNIKTLILGIRSLGKKHNFTFRDIISEMV